MFDFDAGKLLIIGVVALVVIGPKELPGVMRQFGQAVAKLRRMAAEFQGQFMEAMREAELEDLKKELASVQEAAKIDLDFDPVDDVKREMTAAIGAAETAPVSPPESTPVLAAPEPSPQATTPRTTTPHDGADAPAAAKEDAVAATAALAGTTAAASEAAKVAGVAAPAPTAAAQDDQATVLPRPSPAPTLATEPTPSVSAAPPNDLAIVDEVVVDETPAKGRKRKPAAQKSVEPDPSTSRETPSASAAAERSPDRWRSKT
jgi:sec-independent protein translocase protein TatB